MKALLAFGLLHVFFPLSAHGQELGSDAYILSHFHYSASARVQQFQRDPPPTSSRASACGDQLLPAAPGQGTKAYHFDALITFPPHKVHAENQMPPKLPTQHKEGISTHANYCRMENTSNPNKNPSTGTRWCSMAKVGRYVLMSDIFQDTCGTYFRAYWETAAVIESYAHGKPQFTSAEEHGVTSSIGRYDGMQKDPSAPGSYEFVPGPTGAIPMARFLFLVRASEADVAEIQRVLGQQLAPKGIYYRCEDGTFNQEKANCVNEPET